MATKEEKAVELELLQKQVQALGLGIDTEGKTAAQLKKILVDNDKGISETKKVPTAKPRKSLVKPVIKDLYPWALNRRKAETAHNTVKQEVTDAGGKVTEEEFDQRVMDHYTTHGGLVRLQEKATTIGRRKPITPGQTTDQIVHPDDTDTDEDLDD